MPRPYLPEGKAKDKKFQIRVSEIELNADEIAQQLQDEADFVAQQKAKLLMENKKAAALEKLGLTLDELAALLA